MKKLLTIELEEDALVSLLPHILALEADFRVRSTNPVGTVVKAAEPELARKITRRSPDGRSSAQVVLDKVASFGNKKFHIREIDTVARFCGFAPITLRMQLRHMVAQGMVEKINRQYFRAVPPMAATAAVAAAVAVDNEAA